MERFVQLTEIEYNKLRKQAKMKEDEIEQKAIKLYEKKGVYGIDLTISCNMDYNETIHLHAHSCMKDWNSFPISYEDKKRVIKFIDRKALEMMEYKFGKQIEDRSYYKQKQKILMRNHWRFVGVTVLGWLCAIGITLITIAK